MLKLRTVLEVTQCCDLRLPFNILYAEHYHCREEYVLLRLHCFSFQSLGPVAYSGFEVTVP
jgi:hypothetical protein